MEYNTHDYWVFGLFPSSGILENRKHYVSQTESVSVLRWRGKTLTQLSPLESTNLSHVPRVFNISKPEVDLITSRNSILASPNSQNSANCSILTYTNSVHTFPSYVYKIPFNNILPRKPRVSIWSSGLYKRMANSGLDQQLLASQAKFYLIKSVPISQKKHCVSITKIEKFILCTYIIKSCLF
jgi:hypothetical protein